MILWSKMWKLFFQLAVICVVTGQQVTIDSEESNVMTPNAESNDIETMTQDFPDDMAIMQDEHGNDTIFEHDLMPKDTANSTAEIVAPNITKVNCLTNKEFGPVEIVNASRLVELLILEPGPGNKTRNSKESRILPGTCILVLFYARWCVFSSQAAPHFNALPRIFPNMRMVAVDAIKYQSFNTQYGIVGVPTLMLVHSGKPVSKYNETEYKLESFAKYIMHLTNLEPNASLAVTSADFMGPVPSTPSNETDYCLLLSWIFIASCSLYFTSKSRWWCQFVELIQNTWRESNAQHEHTD